MGVFLYPKGGLMAKKRSNGEGSIFFREDKKLWTGTITIGVNPSGSQKKKTFYGPTQKAVREKMRKYESENHNLNKDLTKETLHAWYKKWLYEIKKPHLKPKSWQRYEGLYLNYISTAPFIDNLIGDVTGSEMEIWYNKLKADGHSGAQIKKINELIGSSFEKAINDRAINYNPAKSIKIKAEKTEKINVLSKDEQKKLVNHFLNNKEECGNLILFALGTGMRLGEMMALTWDDYNKLDKTITVSKNLQRIKQADGKYIYEVTTPKSQSSNRIIPLPDKTACLLNDLKKNSPGALIFSKDNGDHLYINGPTRNIHKICDKLNINSISMHGLRHSYATRLFESNIQIKTVQKLMGHSEIETTLNIYTHVMSDIKEEAAERINNFL